MKKLIKRMINYKRTLIMRAALFKKNFVIAQTDFYSRLFEFSIVSLNENCTVNIPLFIFDVCDSAEASSRRLIVNWLGRCYKEAIVIISEIEKLFKDIESADR